jgi:hypothetical protein
MGGRLGRLAHSSGGSRPRPSSSSLLPHLPACLLELLYQALGMEEIQATRLDTRSMYLVKHDAHEKAARALLTETRATAVAALGVGFVITIKLTESVLLVRRGSGDIVHPLRAHDPVPAKVGAIRFLLPSDGNAAKANQGNDIIVSKLSIGRLVIELDVDFLVEADDGDVGKNRSNLALRRLT